MLSRGILPTVAQNKKKLTRVLEVLGKSLEIRHVHLIIPTLSSLSVGCSFTVFDAGHDAFLYRGEKLFGHEAMSAWREWCN